MRTTRVEKFRRSRQKRLKRLVFFVLFVPATCICIGYLISSLVVLPSMVK